VPAWLSRLFLHPGSVGSDEACQAVRDELRGMLREWDGRDEIRGYRMVQIRDAEAAEDELLPLMFDYVQATAGRFPFVYALITPPEHGGTEWIDAAMRDRGLARYA
jgi:hypothetical protein